MEFVWPFAFLLLPLPFIVRKFVRPASLPVNGSLRVPFYSRLVGSSPGGRISNRHHAVRLAAVSVIWTLLIAAFARPIIVGDEVPLPQAGRDLMMAIDLSGSMGEEDIALNGRRATRLDVVKNAAQDFIARRKGDRLGLILFSDRAYLQAPLTFDRTIVTQLLREARVGLTGQKTAIGDAIAIASKRLKDRPEESRVLVLLTDGANNAGVMEPLQAAGIAKDLGIRIYTIGVGAEAMVVRTAFGERVVDPSRDLDEATLHQIADLTGGQYFRAKDVDGLASVYAEIDQLEPVEGKPLTVSPSTALYYWPLSFALILTFALAAATALPVRRRSLDAAQIEGA